MKKNEKILDSLNWLLLSFNIAAFFLSLAFSSRKTNFGWQTGDPLSYFVNSREWPAVPWVNLATLVLSVGIYKFVQGYLEAQEKE